MGARETKSEGASYSINLSITLLGGLTLQSGAGESVRRFRSQKTAALLAYLALNVGRDCPREVLCEILWPEDTNSSVETIQGRLRFALSSLRKQLEPLGVPFGTVLDVSVSGMVRLRREAVTTDVGGLEQAQKRGDVITMQKLLAEGELLPNFYDDWIIEWRNQIEIWRAQLPTGEPNALIDTPKQIKLPVLPENLGELRTLTIPLYLTRFFGRETEKNALIRLLTNQNRRLVTIQGLGGCGKTRLAVETAHEISNRSNIGESETDVYFEHICFVPLAECYDPGQVVDRIRVGLRLPPADTSALEQIACALGRRRLLLILDNLEHLVEGGAPEIVEELLRALPTVSCLVTSRVVLGIEGEQILSLAPLSPEGEASVALFLDRAQATQPDFALTARNKTDILALCRDLEGLPLALELAATRIRMHGLSQMRRQMEEEGRRFALLARADATGRKTPRHASLYATVAGSWRLLPPALQEFLGALSVLRGRWTAPFAAGVMGQQDALPFLETLVAHALVSVDVSQPEIPRFFLLTTIREFADEQLRFDQKQVIRRRYAVFVQEYLSNRDQRETIREEDLSVLQVALENAIEDAKAQEALNLCLVLEEIWLRFGDSQLVLSLIERVLTLEGGEALTYVRVLDIAVYLTKATFEPTRAQSLATQAREFAGDDPHAQALARMIQARVDYRMRVANSIVQEKLETALTDALRFDDKELEADALLLLGLLAARTKDFASANHHTKRVVALHEAQGNRRAAARAIYNLGFIAGQQGDHAHALLHYYAALKTAETYHDAEQLARIQNNIGDCFAHRKRWEESREALRYCLHYARAAGNRHSLLLALWNIVEPLAHLGESAKALALLPFVQEEWRQSGIPRDKREEEDDAEYISQIHALVGLKSQIGDISEAGTASLISPISLEQALEIALQ